MRIGVKSIPRWYFRDAAAHVLWLRRASNSRIFSVGHRSGILRLALISDIYGPCIAIQEAGNDSGWKSSPPSSFDAFPMERVIEIHVAGLAELTIPHASGIDARKRNALPHWIDAHGA